ncbi:MAG: alpha/beta hydrolase [Aggregatilineales bacterium]
MSDLASSTQHITSGAALYALGLPHRVRIPPGDVRHPALIMVHGLDGNEDVTWVFARTAGPEWLILTPRAPLPTSDGFSWYPSTPPDHAPDAASFAAGLAALEKFINGAIAYYPLDPARIVLLGFSQGAALSYSYTFAHPERLIGLGALAGFIPTSAPLPPMNGLPALVLHGTHDERVPIAYARAARDQLQTAGATVTYEESEIGHKLSAQGMRTLTTWLAARLKI